MPEKECARRLRKEMSVAESIFWEKCRKHRLGFEFRRQYPIAGYDLDFFCKEAMLTVEFDGEQHDAECDRDRDEIIAMFGIETLRIPNRDFFMFDAAPVTDWIERVITRCEERYGRTVER
jgi:very-short-patch-repair endonuclease